MKFHESGHGLVAHLLGAVVHEIEVHHGVGGVCRHATLSSATDQLAVLAGGMAGERLLGGEASGASAAHDLADIEMLLPEIRGDPQAALDAAQDRANKLVADNVDKVHALVDALREHGDRLDQQQINQVFGTPGALDRSRLVTAHHESGHAVCALALNRPVHSLRVYADGSGEFRSHPLPEGWTGAVEEEDAIARALFSVPIRHTGTDFRSTDGKLREMCGGMCAQKKFAPSSDWRGNGATDRERARLLEESTNQSHDVVSRRLAYAFAEAERLIDANWPAITKLAQALAERGHLDRDEIMRIVGRFAPAPPAPAITGLRTRRAVG
jgi:ATP-dependent Zn protease